MSNETEVRDTYDTSEITTDTELKPEPLPELVLEPRKFDRATGAPLRKGSPQLLGQRAIEHAVD